MKFYNPIYFCRLAAIVVVTSLLAACGGGSGGGGGNDTDTPVLRAIVGDNISVAEGTEVSVKGFAQGDNSPFTYAWQVQPSSYADSISSEEGEEITFTAPDIVTSTDILLTLAVTDAKGNAATASKTITVNPISSPPIVNLFKADTTDTTQFTIDSGDGFQLSASWIDGEDGTDVASAILYLEQTSGTPMVGVPEDGVRRDLMSNSATPPVIETIAKNEFVNASSQPATLRFTLVVIDQSEITTETSVTVDVLPQADSRPTVSAGSDKVAFEGQVVTLDGTTNGDSMLWRQSSGSVIVDIDNSGMATARFNAPQVSEASELEFTLTATNSNGSSDDSVLVTVLPISPFDGINDTGITNCANATSNSIPCSLEAYPNQDAEVGRDPAQLTDSLSKRGEGEVGFDFTLLDANGDEISSGTPSCIRDNVTELIWEVKSDTGFRSYNSTFSWFDNDTTTNGGNEGVLNGGSCTTETGTLTSCDSRSYQLAVNNTGLCGANDWRLPTVNELMSILNVARLDDLFARDSSLTELWPSHASASVPYWSSQPSAFGIGTGLVAVNAWAVDSSTGNDLALVKTSAARVLLVRGAPENATE